MDLVCLYWNEEKKGVMYKAFYPEDIVPNTEQGRVKLNEIINAAVAKVQQDYFKLKRKNKQPKTFYFDRRVIGILSKKGITLLPYIREKHTLFSKRIKFHTEEKCQ